MITNSFIFYLIALVSCVGAGYLLWTMVLRRLTSDTSIYVAPSSTEFGVIGMFTIGILAVLLNFFVPISQSLSMVLITFCFIVGVTYLVRKPNSINLKLLAIIGVILIFSFWGSRFIIRWDAALYHLQAISWLKDEPIVIGLANIHERFGFNSLMLPTLAVFWLPFYRVEGALLASHLPAIFLVFALISHIYNNVKSSTETSSLSLTLSISVIFSSFCLASVSAVPTLLLTSTTSTDLAPNAFTLLSVLIFLRGFENLRPSSSEINKDHMLLWIVAVFSILAKLSAITPCLIALIYTLYHKDVIGVITIKRTAYFLIGVTGIWLLRNFLMSGCLVYPVGLTCFNPDIIQWSVGPDNADNTRAIIERWAKAPGPGYLVNGANIHWLDNWLEHPMRGGQLVIIGRGVLISALFGISFVVFFQKRRPIEQEKSRRRPLAGAVFVILAALTGLLFGFVSAPDPRFLWGPLVTIFILPVTLVSSLIFQGSISLGKSSVLSVIFLALVITGGYVFMSNRSSEHMALLKRNDRALIPEVHAKSFTANGFVILRPIGDNRCWLAPKPCSPRSPEGLGQYHTGQYSVFTRKTGKTIDK